MAEKETRHRQVHRTRSEGGVQRQKEPPLPKASKEQKKRREHPDTKTSSPVAVVLLSPYYVLSLLSLVHPFLLAEAAPPHPAPVPARPQARFFWSPS